MQESGGRSGGPQQDVTLEGKVVVVGDAGVGKTSLLHAFCRDELGAQTRPNVGVTFFRKSVRIPEEGLTVQYQAWDTAGSERFRSVNTLYYRGAAAGILVFDVTSSASFESLEYWLRELRAYSAGVVVVVCGNKADAPTRLRAVSTATAADWAAAHGCEFLETSAKTGLNVAEVFMHIARAALRQFQQSVAEPPSPAGDDGTAASAAAAAAAAGGSSGQAYAYGPTAGEVGGGGGMAGAFRIISVERRGVGGGGGGGAPAAAGGGSQLDLRDGAGGPAGGAGGAAKGGGCC